MALSKEGEQLKEKYIVIIPIFEGHSGSERDFTTIESISDEIIEYVDEKCSVKVFLLGGLSLGGQILLQVLSKRKDIC